jgi:hypothetical protein
MLARVRRALDGFYAFADQPLFLGARPLLVALLVPLALGLARPLWMLEVQGPAQPAPLWLDVYVSHFESGHEGADLTAINAFHQTIGMRTIDAGSLGELGWMPFGFGILALLLLRVAVLGNVRSLIDLSALVSFFLLFTFARFAQQLRAMGHHLSPDAPTTVAPFTPVMMGTQQIGDVTVRAGPGSGAYLVAGFAVGIVAIMVWHLVLGRRKHEAERSVEAASGAVS